MNVFPKTKTLKEAMNAVDVEVFGNYLLKKGMFAQVSYVTKQIQEGYYGNLRVNTASRTNKRNHRPIPTV